VPWVAIVEALGGLCGVLVLALVIVVRKLGTLRAELDNTTFQNRSLSTTYGRITEQWFPLMDAYPYDPQQFRFLGSPIDGVQFEEDRIVFVEFKANRSRLSRSQQRIRQLVEDGHVYWEEFHFTDDSGSAGH
jgi:hypothetical protein